MLLDGAPDGRSYRSYRAATRAEASRVAAYAALHLAAVGLRPLAERWDEASGELVVAYAPQPGLGRTTGSAKRRLAVVGVLLALLVGGGLFYSTLPEPEGRRVAGDPAAQSIPRSSPADDYSGPLPHFRPADCRSDWLVGLDNECGDLIVLEDRSRPDGRRISLHVAIQRSYSERPRPDPVVYLDGGPGASPLLDGFWSYPFLEERDVIVFDQRGVGLSRPSLDCPEVLFVFLREEIDTLRDCRRRLLEQGVDLAAYNSAASAADLADLRLALGYDEWNLYGISYGTRLALTAMRDRPAGIRSVILDSVYPPQRDLYAEGPANAQRAFDKLFSACAADADCALAYEDLEQRFYDVVARLDGQPREVGGLFGLGGTTVDGSMLINLLFYRLYMTDFLGEIPLAVDGFWRDDWELLDAWLLDVVGASRRLSLLSLSEGQHFSVQCAEELPFSDHALLLAEQPGVRWPLTVAFGWQPTIDVCAMWDVPAAPAHENEPVHSGLPALLLAGTYDPITPPSWAQSAAETLPNAQLFIVPGVGHGVLGTSYCVDDLVEQFLDAPLETVVAGCLENEREPDFLLP
ncbi:MAG TPA: alpha/beta hydrolase [Candidatus Limnocylindria bacterium]|nr:alpha/beta hydrolase [Candidatus Limnocylindria bacterium]